VLMCIEAKQPQGKKISLHDA